MMIKVCLTLLLLPILSDVNFYTSEVIDGRWLVSGRSDHHILYHVLSLAQASVITKYCVSTVQSQTEKLSQRHGVFIYGTHTQSTRIVCSKPCCRTITRSTDWSVPSGSDTVTEVFSHDTTPYGESFAKTVTTATVLSP